MNTLCRYDPYFSRTKHFCQTFKVANLNYSELCGSILNADLLLMTSRISNGLYGMTSSVHRPSAKYRSEPVFRNVVRSNSNKDL